MPNSPEYRKFRTNIKIFAVVQIGLVALLGYMAVYFQNLLQTLHLGFRFMHGVLAAFLIQMVLFFPIMRFASRDAERDLTMTSKNLTKEELKALVKRKRISDIVKISMIGFYVVFIAAAPSNPFMLSIIFYSFILTILTYLQCYNFAAKKLLREATAPKG